jgi:H+/Cl- antiporter ClcA
MASFLSKLCTPAFVYFVLGIFSILVCISCGFGLFSVLAKVILILLWTWFLNYLCVKNLVGLSWFLVVLPYAILLASVFMAIDVVEMKKKSQPPKVVPQQMVASSPVLNTSTKPRM